MHGRLKFARFFKSASAREMAPVLSEEELAALKRKDEERRLKNKEAQRRRRLRIKETETEEQKLARLEAQRLKMAAHRATLSAERAAGLRDHQRTYWRTFGRHDRDCRRRGIPRKSTYASASAQSPALRQRRERLAAGRRQRLQVIYSQRRLALIKVADAAWKEIPAETRTAIVDAATQRYLALCMRKRSNPRNKPRMSLAGLRNHLERAHRALLRKHLRGKSHPVLKPTVVSLSLASDVGYDETLRRELMEARFAALKGTVST